MADPVDIRELEAKAQRHDSTASAEDFDSLARHYWQLAKTAAEHRDRLKLAKRASHFAGRAFDAGMGQADTLRLYMEIARRAAALHAFPQDERRKLAKITARWLELTGAGEHKTLARMKGKITTETATFGLGDVGLIPDDCAEPWREAALVRLMEAGQRLFFATGYDGAISAELRVIAGTLPVLAAKEYGKLEVATPILHLNAPTGRIVLADMAFTATAWREMNAPVSLAVETAPGCYAVCVYGFSSRRSDSVVAVLCAQPASTLPNAVNRVESLFS